MTPKEFDACAREIKSAFQLPVSRKAQEAIVIACLVEACIAIGQRPHLNRIQAMTRAFDGPAFDRERIRYMLDEYLDNAPEARNGRGP